MTERKSNLPLSQQFLLLAEFWIISYDEGKKDKLLSNAIEANSFMFKKENEWDKLFYRTADSESKAYACLLESEYQADIEADIAQFPDPTDVEEMRQNATIGESNDRI